MTLRGLWTAVVMFVGTIVFAGAAAVGSTLRPGSDVAMTSGRIWSRWNLRAAGAHVTWEGLEAATRRLPCIFVANHQSNVDIWALMSVLPKKTRFVAKQSLFRVPILGWALRVSEFIPIDRSNRARAIRSLKDAATKIRGGRPVVLFPEGTRSAGDTLAPFKKGPFHLALDAGVPVVPVAIVGSGAVMPAHGLAVRPGPVRVRFCDAIDVGPYLPKRDIGGLRDVVHRTIAAELARGVAGTEPAAGAATAPSP